MTVRSRYVRRSLAARRVYATSWKASMFHVEHCIDVAPSSGTIAVLLAGQSLQLLQPVQPEQKSCLILSPLLSICSPSTRASYVQLAVVISVQCTLYEKNVLTSDLPETGLICHINKRFSFWHLYLRSQFIHSSSNCNALSECLSIQCNIVYIEIICVQQNARTHF